MKLFPSLPVPLHPSPPSLPPFPHSPPPPPPPDWLYDILDFGRYDEIRNRKDGCKYQRMLAEMMSGRCRDWLNIAAEMNAAALPDETTQLPAEIEPKWS